MSLPLCCGLTPNQITPEAASDPDGYYYVACRRRCGLVVWAKSRQAAERAWRCAMRSRPATRAPKPDPDARHD